MLKIATMAVLRSPKTLIEVRAKQRGEESNWAKRDPLISCNINAPGLQTEKIILVGRVISMISFEGPQQVDNTRQAKEILEQTVAGLKSRNERTEELELRIGGLERVQRERQLEGLVVLPERYSTIPVLGFELIFMGGTEGYTTIKASSLGVSALELTSPLELQGVIYHDLHIRARGID